MAEFVAGYAQILQSKDISALEMSQRQKHLVSLMYSVQQFTRLAVLNFLGSVVLEIECGLIKWGDIFMHLESRTLYSHPLPEKSTAELPVKSGSSKSSPLLSCLLAYFERTRTPLTRFIHSFRFSMMFFSSTMLKPVSFAAGLHMLILVFLSFLRRALVPRVVDHLSPHPFFSNSVL